MVRAPSRHRAAAALLGVSLVVLAACGASPTSTPVPSLSSAPPTTPGPALTSPVTSPTAPRPTSAAPSSTPSSAPTGPPPCPMMAAQLSLSAQVGQLLMVAVSSTQLSSVDAKTVADVRAGSVILLGNSTRGVAGTKRVVNDVRAAARPPKGVQTLVAADQEGGLVQRLKGRGFAAIPSAQVQSGWSDAKLAERATGWGAQLAKAGIDANLAPVADVVPTSMEQVNQPIGLLHRGYGPSPKKVAAKSVAFNRGMQEAGIATGAKHFPGLGRVRGNTDFAANVVDSVTTRHDATLAGFRALVRDNVDMVMVSSATYAKIDRRHRAAFSATVIGSMLRGDLDFTGVVISDDLSAAALRDVSPGQRAVRFVAAGGDLAIVGDPRHARAMASALHARAEQNPRFAKQVTRSAGRVLAMKARGGQAACSPG